MPVLFDQSEAQYVGYARVALERGIDTTGGLTYGIPAKLGRLEIGQRVIVPLGRTNKEVAGYVIGLDDHCDLATVKPVIERDPQRIALTADLIQLAQWMANYYCSPLGMVFANMLPAAVKHGTGTKAELWVGVTEEGKKHAGAKAPKHEGNDDSGPRTPNAGPTKTKLTKLQRAALQVAIAHENEHPDDPLIEMRYLADLAGAKTNGPVKQLVDKGLLAAQQRTTVAAAEGVWDAIDRDAEFDAPRVTLNTDQQQAVDHLADHIDRGFSVNLLHGVTGSGKTEVYLRVIEGILGRHEGTEARRHEEKKAETRDPRPEPRPLPGAIVLVPEISLTPQTARRFHERFRNVAVLHSGLTAAQRHQQWQRIRQGKANIVVGARSAIFAPLADLRLIIVDEEHEQSYKQDQLPRYHARDVAIKRSQLLGIPCLLGSATPSLESYFNAAGLEGQATEPPSHQATSPGPETRDPRPETRLPRPRYHLLQLPERVTGLKLPRVEIADMQAERRKRYQMEGSGRWHLLSIKLEKLLQQTIKAGGQAILLLNRRGYANYIACADHNCGWQKFCDYCDTTMVYHKNAALPAGGLIRCHHCSAEQLLPRNCPDCGKKVTTFGLGTQRVEEEIARVCSDATIVRMDSDSMNTGRDYHDALERFRHGEVDILVGTQMIAKGLDFPNVRLVGVISADTALHLPDFRASERTFQLIAQVAGRAGRGSEPGRVVVQTFSPDDPVIELASHHDYESFAQRELKLRAGAGLPPVGRMARLVVRDRDLATCTKLATELAKHLRTFNKQLGNTVNLRGPAPCPIARIADFHRQQIELIAPPPDAAATLQRLMTALRNARLLKSDARTAVDVDPVALL